MADPFTLEDRTGLGIATIMARKGTTREALAAALGTPLPEGTRALRPDGVALIGTGPGMWVAISEAGSADFATELATRLAGLASVSDQSGGYAVCRLSGAGARTVLQRGAAIDLHPSVFAAGAAATTVISHIGVIVWQIDDAPTYDLALFRSYTASFRHWLDEAVAAL
ncbi:hypothetical protein BH10PSE15_BH10PSE15_03510 [soil metagenome]